MKFTDTELVLFPFLNSNRHLIKIFDISIDKIETTKIYDEIIREIFNDFTNLIYSGQTLLFNNIEVTKETIKYYLSIMFLKFVNNIGITKLWINDQLKKFKENYFRFMLDKSKEDTEFINYYLLKNIGFEPNKITSDGTHFFGWHMTHYLDIGELAYNDKKYLQLQLVNCTLHKGYVIVPTDENETIQILIELWLNHSIFNMYNYMEYDISNTTKIKYFVDSLIDKVLKSAISESNKNIKANFIGRQEAIRQLEMKNINTAKEIMIKLHEFSKDKTYQDLSGLPPCINKILDKMFRLRQKLSNDENFFLCTFLGKKGYTKDDVIFIFSNAPNYNKNITDYHVKRLLAKGTMPPSCSKLATELLCFPDNLCEKYKIKSPLVYRSET